MPYTTRTNPTTNPTDTTIVYVYGFQKGGTWDFAPKPANKAVCPECSAPYREMAWCDEYCPGDGDYLQCGCGEQFMQTND